MRQCAIVHARWLRLVCLFAALAVGMPPGLGPASAAYGGAVAGTVVNLYLEPMKGVTVTLEWSETATGDLVQVGDSVLTDANGAFSFTTTQSGWYNVRAEAISGEVLMARAANSGRLQVPPSRSGLLLRILFKPDLPEPYTPGFIVGTPAVGQTLTKVAPVFPTGITCDSGGWFYFPATGAAERISAGPRMTVSANLAGFEVLVYYLCSQTVSYNDQGLPNRPKSLSQSFPYRTRTVRIAVPDPGKTKTTKPKTNQKVSDLPKLSKTPRPRIVGAPVVGRKLKVKLGKWDKGVTKKIRWYVGGKAVKNAKAKSFKLKRKYLSKRVKVRITGTKRGYAKVVVTSKSKRIRSR